MRLANIAQAVETREGALAFMSDLTATLSLLVLGFPLNPGAIVASELDLAALPITQLVLRPGNPIRRGDA